MANLMQIKTSSANITKIKIEEDATGVVDVDAAEPSPPQRERDDGICELEHLRKLFIGGLARYTTEDGLREYYNQWGNVVDVVVMRDPATKRSRGFGFITYTKSSMVDKAQENRPHIIDGKTVEAKRALPRPERETREVNISVKKLFVGGLKDNHDEESLHDYFSEFGKVISVKILSDKTTGKRRGFAFIEFDDYDAVDKAILRKVHSIKYVIVDVKKSVYQEQKKRQFENGNGNALQNGNGISNDNRPPHAPMGGAPPKYRPPPPHTMPPYQQPPPMNAGPPPPQNYNYWGPPQQAMPQQYGGYQQPPPPQMNAWGYPPAPNGWNAGPPPPPAGPAPTWQPNQWGPPPTGPAPPGPPGSGMPPPNPNWNAPQAAPPMPPPPGASNVQPQQQVPHNFGTGYQQNYGGGPAKHNMNSNRMNPYNAPPNNNYAHRPPGPPVSGYGGGGYGNGIPGNPKPPGVAPPVNNGPPGTKPIPNGSGAGGSNYRR